MFHTVIEILERINSAEIATLILTFAFHGVTGNYSLAVRYITLPTMFLLNR